MARYSAVKRFLDDDLEINITMTAKTVQDAVKDARYEMSKDRAISSITIATDSALWVVGRGKPVMTIPLD